MAETVKDLAKKWSVTRQAIRARINRIKGFKSNYTQLKNNIRIISDAGVKVLERHGNNSAHVTNNSDKRLLIAKIHYLTSENNDLRVSNKRLYGIASREQNLNVQLNYYRNTTWIERLFGIKPKLAEQPKTIQPYHHVNANDKSNKHDN